MKILVCTDSRGINSRTLKSLKYDVKYEHYTKKLIDKYSAEVKALSWATVLTYLDKIKNTEGYDVLILHAGIVDFAPRKMSSCNKIYKRDKKNFKKIFGINATRYVKTPHWRNNCNAPKNNMYSLGSAEKYIAPLLADNKKLIWISNNKIVDKYNKKSNLWLNDMKIVADYDSIIISALGNSVINLYQWNEKNVRDYTIDSIHFNAAGSNALYYLIADKLDKLICKK